MFEPARIKIRDASNKNSDPAEEKKRHNTRVIIGFQWSSVRSSAFSVFVFLDSTAGVQTGSLTERGKVHSQKKECGKLRFSKRKSL